MVFSTSIYTYGRIALSKGGQIHITDNLFAGDMGKMRTSLDPHRRYLKAYLFFLLTGVLEQFPEVLPGDLEHFSNRFRYVSLPGIVNNGSH